MPTFEEFKAMVRAHLKQEGLWSEDMEAGFSEDSQDVGYRCYQLRWGNINLAYNQVSDKIDFVE
jgi:hypothetical protein